MESNLELLPNDYRKNCRTCFIAGETETIFNDNGIKFVDMLKEVAGVQVDKFDGLPQNICTTCIVKLQAAHSFKIQCVNVDIQIRSQISDLNIKIENNESLDAIKVLNTSKKHFDLLENEKNFGRKISGIKKKKIAKRRKQACSLCKKLFTSSQLKIHMRSHTEQQPYKCNICKKQFSFRGNLTRHFRIHTGERPHKCAICAKGFIQSTALADHIRVHTGETPFTCSQCGKSFTQPGQLRRHTQKNCNSTTERRNNKTDIKSTKLFDCEVCKRSYSGHSVLKTHLLTHGDKTYLCSDCGKGFVTRAGLKSHSKVHTGEKPYKCAICSKSFSQTGSLKAHKLIHTGEKPHVCQWCSKAFTQGNHLKYHLRIHSGEKPYECSVCKKRFSLNGTLTVHMRRHTGETPYHCPVCGKGFYDSSSMKKHNSRHTMAIPE